MGFFETSFLFQNQLGLGFAGPFGVKRNSGVPDFFRPFGAFVPDLQIVMEERVYRAD